MDETFWSCFPTFEKNLLKLTEAFRCMMGHHRQKSLQDEIDYPFLLQTHCTWGSLNFRAQEVDLRGIEYDKYLPTKLILLPKINCLAYFFFFSPWHLSQVKAHKGGSLRELFLGLEHYLFVCSVSLYSVLSIALAPFFKQPNLISFFFNFPSSKKKIKNGKCK